MDLFNKLGIDSKNIIIDWQMTPLDSFGLFESRGDMQRVKSSGERHYYFYIDNWQQPAQLCLMERGIRFARVLATINAPQNLIDQCIREQGKTYKEHNYAINGTIRQWLEDKVLNSNDSSNVIPAIETPRKEVACGLPGHKDHLPELQKVILRKKPQVLSEDQIPVIVSSHGFFEHVYNPVSSFTGYLLDNGDGLTVTDMVTEITWQRSGSEHGFRRRTNKWITTTNQNGFAGHKDWRLPTTEEILSLLIKDRNADGLYLHPCFSPVQGYVFTADLHKPGGYWFVDFRQARVFWAGGTFSGGFARLCRG